MSAQSQVEEFGKVALCLAEQVVAMSDAWDSARKRGEYPQYPSVPETFLRDLARNYRDLYELTIELYYSAAGRRLNNVVRARCDLAIAICRWAVLWTNGRLLVTSPDRDSDYDPYLSRTRVQTICQSMPPTCAKVSIVDYAHYLIAHAQYRLAYHTLCRSDSYLEPTTDNAKVIRQQQLDVGAKFVSLRARAKAMGLSLPDMRGQ